MKIRVSQWVLIPVAVLAGMTAQRLMQPLPSAEAVNIPVTAAEAFPTAGEDVSVPPASSVRFDETTQSESAPPTF